jgi:hypothetical protein
VNRAALRGAFVIAVLDIVWASPGVAAGLPSYEEEPIRYSATPANDPVARLAGRVARGDVALERDGERGYLTAILRELGVPASSQVLVFSKTSLQRTHISPRRPRAIYFNDEIYVGWVPDGDVLEIASVDPRQGTIFYVMPQESSPRIQRATHECLQCHDSSSLTGGIPGLTVRSVYPDSDGQPVLSSGSFVTDHKSPMNERWGGWYVTGKHGRQRHMGNATLRNEDDINSLDRDGGANLMKLGERIDPIGYPSAGSDIVALLVLAHQTQLHNLITQASYETRSALRYEAAINEALGRPLDTRADSTLSRIHSAAEAVVEALLFSGEAPLERVIGSSSFAQDWSRRGPRDGKGRSLRDLDLGRRLLRYPCSPLIYGPSFDALPPLVRDRIVDRLGQILNGRDQSPAFAHLSAGDRQAIQEILIETKPELRARWTSKTAKRPDASP